MHYTFYFSTNIPYSTNNNTQLKLKSHITAAYIRSVKQISGLLQTETLLAKFFSLDISIVEILHASLNMDERIR